ncbi:dTDP-4-dehydrorhamnose 3,5-epimerase [Polaribacter sp. M15]
MKVIHTNLKGCFVIEPKIFDDGRGSFFESFNQKVFKEKTGLDTNFVQDNQSISQRGVLRGLHHQVGEFAQAKLVRVIQGRVLDVAVDFRKDSQTFGQHFSVELSGKNNKQLFVPRGFLHGFATLEDNTIFSYKCDNYYNPESDAGYFYDDPFFNINWMLKKEEIILSEKDNFLPRIKLMHV